MKFQVVIACILLLATVIANSSAFLVWRRTCWPMRQRLARATLTRLLCRRALVDLRWPGALQNGLARPIAPTSTMATPAATQPSSSTTTTTENPLRGFEIPINGSAPTTSSAATNESSSPAGSLPMSSRMGSEQTERTNSSLLDSSFSTTTARPELLASSIVATTPAISSTTMATLPVSSIALESSASPGDLPMATAIPTELATTSTDPEPRSASEVVGEQRGASAAAADTQATTMTTTMAAASEPAASAPAQQASRANNAAPMGEERNQANEIESNANNAAPPASSQMNSSSGGGSGGSSSNEEPQPVAAARFAPPVYEENLEPM